MYFLGFQPACRSSSLPRCGPLRGGELPGSYPQAARCRVGSLPSPRAWSPSFFSYASEDAPLAGELIEHLGGLERAGLIAELDAAAAVVLLVSADSLDDARCYAELTRALARRGEAQVFLLIARPCDWDHLAIPGVTVVSREVVAATRAALEACALAVLARTPFHVPFPRNEGFVGRKADLAHLHELLREGGAVGVGPAALTGMGGIGKTQLAVEYAYRYRGAHRGGVYWVNGVAVTAEDRFAISASRDKTLRVWDLGTGQQVRTLEGHTSAVSGVAVTPDGRFAVSPDGRTLLAGDRAGGLHILDLLPAHQLRA